MAASLGSDVPFFLMGGTALGLGRGEELYPFPEPRPSPGLLVVPDIHVSTPEAYRALRRPLTPASPSRNTNTFQSFGWMAGEGLPLDGWSRFCQNDFEEVVFTGYPRIQTLKRKLWKLGARPAMLTGSGAGVFGFFPAPGHARQAALRFPGEKVFVFDLVSRARYRSLWRRALGQDKEDAAWPPRSSHAG